MFITTEEKYLESLFGLQNGRDYEDETDEYDLAFQGGMKYTLRTTGNVLIFGLSYHNQGESVYSLEFSKDGESIVCNGTTSSPRFIAGGNGQYVNGKPGIHWSAEDVEKCKIFLQQKNV